MIGGMTDLEVMHHRFSRENIHKSTGTIAQVLGIDRKEYEAAVERGMKQEAEIRKAKIKEAEENGYWK